jgi:hypothetical protein
MSDISKAYSGLDPISGTATVTREIYYPLQKLHQ